MKEKEVEKILKKRINNNNKIFNISETEMIIKDINLFSKVYFLGLLDKNLMQCQEKVIKNEVKV